LPLSCTCFAHEQSALLDDSDFDPFPISRSRVLGILKNPSYAGMYVFGRYQYRVQINAQGKVRKRMQAVAMPDWRVRLTEHHEGYVTLQEFLKNTESLEKNRTHGEETILSGPAREGLALLQGLFLRNATII
jgi:hypothetical protein